MVKINLLPGYIFEKGRILLTVVVFVVLLGVEGGVLYRAKTDIEDIEKGYVADTPEFGNSKTIITAAETKAKEWEGKTGTYTEYINFFTGTTVQPHTAQIKRVLAEAPTKFRPAGLGNLWFTKMTIAGKTVTAEGKIEGLANYVNYFFLMDEKGVKVQAKKAPAVLATREATYAQSFEVTVSTELADELPATAPADPPKAVEWTEMLKLGGGGGAAEGGDASSGGAPPAN